VFVGSPLACPVGGRGEKQRKPFSGGQAGTLKFLVVRKLKSVADGNGFEQEREGIGEFPLYGV
jgi:hypothetical protein